MTGPFRYRHCGLLLESSISLPLRTDIALEPQADVTVTAGALQPGLPGYVAARRHFHFHADGSCVLHSPDGIKFHLANGRAIRVDAPAQADQRDLRAWLLGPALALVLHQRGLPPLHATAVTVAGQAVAIAGDSGHGKSTTARALARRGHLILSDDHVIIDPVTRLVPPGSAGLRLWADVAGLFADEVTESARIRPEEDKFTIRRAGLFDVQSRPLAAIFVLSPVPCDRPAIRRLSPGQAVPMLHRHVVRLRLATIMGGASAIFRWATAIARCTRVYSLLRPSDLTRLDELARLIEQCAEEGG